jgi:hypothetical protein
MVESWWNVGKMNGFAHRSKFHINSGKKICPKLGYLEVEFRWKDRARTPSSRLLVFYATVPQDTKKEQKRPSFILHKKEEHIWIFCLTFINIMTVPTHTVCTHDMYYCVLVHMYICRSPPGLHCVVESAEPQRSTTTAVYYILT